MIMTDIVMTYAYNSSMDKTKNKPDIHPMTLLASSLILVPILTISLAMRSNIITDNFTGISPYHPLHYLLWDITTISTFAILLARLGSYRPNYKRNVYIGAIIFFLCTLVPYQLNETFAFIHVALGYICFTIFVLSLLKTLNYYQPVYITCLIITGMIITITGSVNSLAECFWVISTSWFMSYKYARSLQ